VPVELQGEDGTRRIKDGLNRRSLGKERDNQRRSVFGRLAGYEDVNDAERLSRDPTMRAIVEPKGLGRRAASTSQMGRFETVWLATEENLAGLDQSLGSLDRPGSPERVTKFYQGRGTAEPWIKAGKNAINWTRQSCHSFRNNEVRL